ncbi:MAG: nucleotide exchange factor GrpE [Clostridia bacterium]|nr:nucleotide exchange factor GrpE [Clostridia bacterium]
MSKKEEKQVSEENEAVENAEQQPAPEVKEESEIEKALAAAEDYKRKWYAVSAEYDNYRKRTQLQASQAYQDGKADAVLKLLPVADTFGYAYDGASDEKTKAGIDKIIKNFNNILSSLGIEEIPLKVGDKFDESVAEAIMNVPAEDGEEANVIKLILKKGYKSGEKVIRYAQVSVTI